MRRLLIAAALAHFALLGVVVWQLTELRSDMRRYWIDVSVDLEMIGKYACEAEERARHVRLGC